MRNNCIYGKECYSVFSSIEIWRYTPFDAKQPICWKILLKYFYCLRERNWTMFSLLIQNQLGWKFCQTIQSANLSILVIDRWERKETGHSFFWKEEISRVREKQLICFTFENSETQLFDDMSNDQYRHRLFLLNVQANNPCGRNQCFWDTAGLVGEN